MFCIDAFWNLWCQAKEREGATRHVRTNRLGTKRERERERWKTGSLTKRKRMTGQQRARVRERKRGNRFQMNKT